MLIISSAHQTLHNHASSAQRSYIQASHDLHAQLPWRNPPLSFRRLNQYLSSSAMPRLASCGNLGISEHSRAQRELKGLHSPS